MLARCRNLLVDCVILFGPVSDLFVRSKLYSLSFESDEETGVTVTLKSNVASSSNEQNPSLEDVRCGNVLLCTLDICYFWQLLFLCCANNRVLKLWQLILCKLHPCSHNLWNFTHHQQSTVFSSFSKTVVWHRVLTLKKKKVQKVVTEAVPF